MRTPALEQVNRIDAGLNGRRGHSPRVLLKYFVLTIALLAPALSCAQQPYFFKGYAGSGVLASSSHADGVGLAASFLNPGAVAVGDSGSVYVADTLNHTIRKISSMGVVITLAGSAGSYGNADGTGSAARFSSPQGLAVDSQANVYVADYGNQAIRKITPAGVVTTLAGSPLHGSADGAGSAAGFFFPCAVAIDAADNLYVADTHNSTIRKISPSGNVTTLAGSPGIPGQVDGSGSAARFAFPQGVAVDASGNIYVADTSNHTIRLVTAAGVVTTLAGAAGQMGNTDATGSAARFNSPQKLSVDASGNVYVVDSNNHSIRRITPAGVVSTVAGNSGFSGSLDGMGASARFRNPGGIATSSSGELYVADTGNNSIRNITTNWMVTTFAGSAGASGEADGNKVAARFTLPRGIALDGAGNLYVADTGNSVIRKITSAGTVTTLAGVAGVFGNADGTGSAARFYNPRGVAVDAAGQVYVADSENQTIRKITPGGVTTTVAGLAGQTGTADGIGSSVRFNGPHGLAVDAAGNVYVADSFNHSIRKITPAGAVTTFAGSSGLPGSTDGAGAEARFNYPEGLAIDSAGNILVADLVNETIRKITPAGVVTTLAGKAGVSGLVDGLGGNARFFDPIGVAVDAAGNVFVAEINNRTIRKITLNGEVTTIGGSAVNYGSTNGSGNSARFLGPVSVAVDASGNLYLADTYYNTIITGKIPPGITDQSPLRQVLAPGNDLSLSVVAAGSGPFLYQWSHNGHPIEGATDSVFTVPYVGLQDNGYYFVDVTNEVGATRSAPIFLTVAPSVTKLRFWGRNDLGQGNIPGEANDVVAISSPGNAHTLALRRDGSVIAWGVNDNGQTNVPSGLSDVVAVAASNVHSIALRSNGSVVSWGFNGGGLTDVPVGLEHVVAIAAGPFHSLALKSDGMVVSWGNGAAPPPGLAGVVAIATAANYSLALKSDGTVVSWGDNVFGETIVPAGLSGIIAIAAGDHYAQALKNDGTVVAWGFNPLADKPFPSGLSGVVALSSCSDHSLAIRSDGTVVGWGYNGGYGQSTAPSDLANVIAVSPGFQYSIALEASPIVLAPIKDLTLYERQSATFSVTLYGSGPFTYQWQKNKVNIPGATGSSYSILRTTINDVGDYNVIVSNAVGSVASNSAILTVKPSHSVDFNLDGQADVLWQNTATGQRALWLMNGIGGGFTPASIVNLGWVDTNWVMAGTGDFNSDGQTDILWQNTVTGQRALWLMNGIMGGFTPASIVNLGYVDTRWVMAGMGDFNSDGQTDILWQNTVTGQRALWLMNGIGGGFTPASIVNLGYVDTTWVMAGTGDFNADGQTDILWQNTVTGQRALWLMNGIGGGFTPASIVNLGYVDTTWVMAGTGDFNSDGQTDILWQNTVTGQRALWLMNGIGGGFTPVSIVDLGYVDTNWVIAK